ncbi:DNA mismatch repair, partial [Hepatospora eriocheir]
MIKKLPDQLITKITADEVITSYYSAVKELLENALDANSTSITIQIGKNTLTPNISIRDNGTGIDESDLELLCVNNCTSKCTTTIKDVHTYGFRGEALHAISLACQQIKVNTIKSNNDLGFSCIYKDGVLIEKKLIQLSFNQGTEITVENLFHNNFIRKSEYLTKKMYNKVNDLIKTYTAVNLNISINNSQYNNINESVSDLFKLTTYHLIDKPQYKVIYSHYNINTFYLTVNNRKVNNKELRKLLFKNRTNTFLFISLYSNEIDFNIHPSKDEVLIENKEVYESIINEVNNYLNLNVITSNSIETNSLNLTNKDKIKPFNKQYSSSSIKQLKLSNSFKENDLIKTYTAVNLNISINNSQYNNINESVSDLFKLTTYHLIDKPQYKVIYSHYNINTFYLTVNNRKVNNKELRKLLFK